MTGSLRIVGVGPGDPELITLKAMRLIGGADVVAHFRKPGRPGNAWCVARAHVGAQAEVLAFDYPYTTEIALSDPAYAAGMGPFYDACAAQLAGRLDAGRESVLLCEGDPFFYGSAMYLQDRLRAAYDVEIVPGVTGMSGSWSRAGVPMVHGDDVLSVLPGTLEEDVLAARLRDCEAAVVMKLGRNLPKVRAALAAAGRLERAIYVERGTMAAERIVPLSAHAGEPAPYFALVLVPGRQGPR